MKKSKTNFILAKLVLVLFLVSHNTRAQDKAEQSALELINTYNTYAELLSDHSELKKKSEPIKIGEDYIYFYGKDSTDLIKKIKREKPAFTSDDLAEFKRPKRTRGVSRIEHYYKIIDQQALFVTRAKVDYNSETDISRNHRLSSKLYNKKGELIKSFGSIIDFVKFSPDGKYFVATRTGISPNDTLYFYNSSGQLLNFQKTDRPGMEFSANSEYLKVTQHPRKTFYLYTTNGKYVFHANLWDKLKIGGLFKSFVIDSLNYLLFSTCRPFEQIYLTNISGEVLWHQSVKRVLHIYSLINQRKLILYTIDDRTKNLIESSKSIVICSIEDGSILDEINDCKLIDYRDNRLILEKGGEYYEYKVL